MQISRQNIIYQLRCLHFNIDTFQIVQNLLVKMASPLLSTKQQKKVIKSGFIPTIRNSVWVDNKGLFHSVTLFNLFFWIYFPFDAIWWCYSDIFRKLILEHVNRLSLTLLLFELWSDYIYWQDGTAAPAANNTRSKSSFVSTTTIVRQTINKQIKLKFCFTSFQLWFWLVR